MVIEPGLPRGTESGLQAFRAYLVDGLRHRPRAKALILTSGRDRIARHMSPKSGQAAGSLAVLRRETGRLMHATKMLKEHEAYIEGMLRASISPAPTLSMGQGRIDL